MNATSSDSTSGSKKASSQSERGEKPDDEMNELIERAADGYAKRMREGEKIGLASVLEDVVSAIMKKEREYFLQEVPDTPNGFYSRMLQLAIGKLKLKVPRVRISNAFRQHLHRPGHRFQRLQVHIGILGRRGKGEQGVLG